MKGRDAQSQLGKTGAYGETDLAVALLGFASSPRNQAALKTARVTPRSECTTGAPPHLWVEMLTLSSDNFLSGNVGKMT